MKIYAIIFIIFGIAVIFFPELIGILVGSFFIFIGVNMLVLGNMFEKNMNGFKKDGNYTQWGKYKIFK